MNNLIDIGLATFNGEKYITTMLDSIKGQLFQDFIIHICDDSSIDSTLSMIKNHPLYFQQKICIHETTGGNGSLKNFRRVLKYCNASYVALCDQDDYWYPSKLSTMFDCCINSNHEKSHPLLVFSDLEVVDKNLNLIKKSFFNSTQKSNKCSKPEDFIVSNQIPGCSMMFNQELKKIFEPMPLDIRMHDWWIALVASLYGDIVYLDEPLIKYRQHAGNAVGALTCEGKNILLECIAYIRSFPTILKRSKKIKNELLNINKRFVIPDKHAELIRVINGKSSLLEKIAMAKKSHSGTYSVMSYLTWFFL
ncbi:MAG: glycosyltransferase family 2 protein [Candidatus Malihini olakiniferum]